MICGKDFVWLHLGKTGGTTTDYLFRQIPEICTFYDNQGYPHKHDNLFDCEKRLKMQLGNKKVYINFRRLIPWILSHNNHQQNNSKTKQGLVYGTLAGKQGFHNPDDWLRYYIDKLDVEMFFRLENLEEDFRIFLNNKNINKKIICPKLNVRKYNKIQFTPNEIEKIYRQNPLWHEIEQKIYK